MRELWRADLPSVGRVFDAARNETGARLGWWLYPRKQRSTTLPAATVLRKGPLYLPWRRFSWPAARVLCATGSLGLRTEWQGNQRAKR